MPTASEVRQHQRPMNVLIGCGAAWVAAAVVEQAGIHGWQLLAVLSMGALLVALSLGEAVSFLLLGNLRHVRRPDREWVFLFAGLAIGWLAMNEYLRLL